MAIIYKSDNETWDEKEVGKILLPMEMTLFQHFISPFGYERQAYAIELEAEICGGRFADLLILTSDYFLVEVEIKRSMTDFYTDFKSKQFKHRTYKKVIEEGQRVNAWDYSSTCKTVDSLLIPHRLYFAFPDEGMCERAKEWLKKNDYSYYGIYLVTDNKPLEESSLRIFKRCRSMHTWRTDSYIHLVRHMGTSGYFLNFFKEAQFKRMAKRVYYLETMLKAKKEKSTNLSDDEDIWATIERL